MNTTVLALQNLYVALGGELADVENIVLIPDMINAIAELKSNDVPSGDGQDGE